MIPKEYLIDFDNLKVGDSVWLHGQIEDKVKSIIHTNECPILISEASYTRDGRFTRVTGYISLFAKPFNFKEQERVILVKNCNVWEKRVLIKFVNSKPLCWAISSNIENAIDKVDVTLWNDWKELEEETVVELTLQQVSNGEGVGVPAHLLRIKQ